MTILKMKPLFDRLLENLPAKIICFVIALFLYLFYLVSTFDTKNFSVPLEVSAHGSYVPSSRLIKNVRISVRGKADQVIHLQESDFNAYLDMDYFAEPGQYTLPVKMNLSARAVAYTPLEIKIDPAVVTARVDRRVTAEVPITPSFTGEVETGYELSSFSLVPEYAQISGPESIVSGVSEFKTAPVILSGKNSGFSLRVSLVNKNELIEIDTSSIITVMGSIQPKISVRQFADIPVTLLNLSDNFTVIGEIPTVSVEIKAPETQLATYPLPSFSLQASCAHITEPGLYELDVRAIVPAGFSVENIIPRKIVIQVEEQEKP